MSEKKIIILGDSTSISLGRVYHNYVDIMARNACWPAEVVFENFSFPGATSNEMLQVFKGSVLKGLSDVFGLVVYLGNCDAASTPLLFKKGLFNKSFLMSKEQFSDEERLRISRNRFRPFEWNDNYDPRLESPVAPETFQENIEEIVRISLKRKIQVVLINPAANKDFIPGLGKGNCLFYHFVGLGDKLSQKLKIADPRFLKACCEKENGHYDKANNLFENILEQPPENIISKEYPLLVANNFAASLAEAGNYREAKVLLELLISERHMRKEIALYNLSQVERKLGNEDEAKHYKKLSFEADFSLYRIKESYRSRLDNIIRKYKNLKVVDINDFLNQINFIDHCHMDLDGHKILAKELIKKFNVLPKNSKSRATVINVPLSPAALRGDFSDFFVFNAAFEPASALTICELYEDLDENLEFKKASKYSIDDKLNKTLNEFKKHPLTHNKPLLFSLEPDKDIFWGKFPEYAISYRLLQLTKAYPVHSKRLFNSFPNLFEHLSLEIQMKFLEPLFNWDPQLIGEKFNKFGSRQDYKVLQKKINAQIDEIYETDWEPSNRVKLTLVWYVRESLRFGGQSRLNSSFDRLELEKLAEALFVIMLDAQVVRGETSPSIWSLASKIEKLLIFFTRYSNQIFDNENQIDQKMLSMANLQKRKIKTLKVD